MGDTYENKLQAEIDACDNRLAELIKENQVTRSRRSALRDALSMYAENKPRRTPRKLKGAAKRISRFGFILKEIKKSGERGLSTKEMYAKAREAGFEHKPNTIRSQLYHRKDDGRLEHQENGRYRFPISSSKSGSNAAKDEALDASTSSASSINGGAATPPNESRKPRKRLFD